MFKKTLLVGAIALAASGAALADGFYVGGDLGATSFMVKDQINQSSSGFSSSVDTGKLGGNIGLLGGYAWVFPNQFFLGAEAFAQATSAKINFNAAGGGSSDDADVKLRYVYGLRVLPGYALTPDTNVYGIVGYARANVKFDGSAGTVSGSTTKNFNGYQLGLGSMTNINKNVALRGDVIYTGYQSKTFTANATDLTDNTTNSYSTSEKFTPSSLEGNVAVVYKFG